jgi:predicted amidophosphoribosyltransferase
VCGVNLLLDVGCALSSRPSPDHPAISPALVEQLASLIAPPLCAACGRARDEGETLCERCLADLAAAPRVIEAGPPGVDLAVAASPFDGVARRLVHALKYARRLSLAGLAAEAMLGALPGHESPQAVVAVPAGPWRRRWRGFDPAEELAVAVAARAGLPLRDCLRRSGGRRQVGRRRFERLADPPRVRAIREAPAAALLVDDVWTTGATLAACAGALREAGSRRIVALALARA